jgi:choline dehydrogenase-like flavoprotein
MRCRYDNRDINGEFQTGFMIAQGTTRRGTRCSTGKAFLRPARLRKNLHVAMESHVTRVLIESVTKRAFGVEFSREGKLNIVRARKEVIVSGGSVNSPQLLMLSGIGPREHLQVCPTDQIKLSLGAWPFMVRLHPQSPPAILHDNFTRESHKPYGPLTSVT